MPRIPLRPPLHAALGLVLLAACQPAAPASLTALEVAPTSAALVVGQTLALHAHGTFSDGDAGAVDVTWRSSAPGVARVDDAGLVTAVGPGPATVTASVQGLEAGAALTVTAPPTGPALVSAEVVPAALYLTQGEAARATYLGTFDGGGVEDLTVRAAWRVGDPTVAQVADGGLLTALAPGRTTLTGTVDGVSAEAQVWVEAPASYDPGAGWTLAWADEFSGAAVDPASWTFDLGSGGWGNSESEYYRAENAVVAGGVLTITARQEPFGDAPYTSARLQTSRKRAFTYGKFSMRARLPGTQGMWPAFWLLGANSNSFGLYGGNVTWPGCGEADIMELIGGLADRSGDFTTHGTLHYLDASGRNPAPSFAYRNAEKLDARFHVYELVWTPHSFTWKFDGLAYATRIITADMEEFTRPMFILVNLAVGGPWGGWPDASTVFPQRYVVDWVRVYGNAGTVPGGAPGLATAWHLSKVAAPGGAVAGESLDPLPGTTSGFQPLKVLAAPAIWWSPPLTGRFEEGAWTASLFTTSPGGSAVVKAEVFLTASDGTAPVSLGTAQVDVNQTGLGNHRSNLTVTGVPPLTLAGQRLKLVLAPVSGLAATLVYNGNDFDSLLTTPWSAAP